MACDHIYAEIDGSMQGGAPLCGPVCAKPGEGNIDDGRTYAVDMDWNSATNTLDIYFNDVLRLSCTNNFITSTFGGASSVYWGITSARGGLNNQQYFCPTTVIILPAEMGHFSTVCDGTSEYFEWTAFTENRVDYFTLEYTYGGLVFHPVESVSSAGQSLDEVEYMLKIESQDPKQRYYRLKIVDEDGRYEYTDLIAGKACGTSQNQLISSISQEEDNLKISLYEDALCILVNQLGQVIICGMSSNQQVQAYTNGLTKGIYFLKVEIDGEVETKKLYLD